MKNIFLRPIGTVRDLGKPTDWLVDAIGIAIVLASAVLAWIIL